MMNFQVQYRLDKLSTVAINCTFSLFPLLCSSITVQGDCFYSSWLKVEDVNRYLDTLLVSLFSPLLRKIKTEIVQ